MSIRSFIRRKKIRYEAALDDCNQFLNRMAVKPAVTFKFFAEVWQDMKFSLIFCGFKSKEELKEFCDEILMAAKTFWLPPSTCERRLMAGYLIYGLYMKQPCGNEVQYRITHKDFAEIVDYIYFIRDRQLNEHLYMFQKLVEENAFAYCAIEHEFPFEHRSQKHDAVDLHDAMSSREHIAEKAPSLAMFISKELVDVIMGPEQIYKTIVKFGYDHHFVPRHASLGSGMTDLAYQLKNLCYQRILTNVPDDVVPLFRKNKVKAISRRRKSLLKDHCPSETITSENITDNELDTQREDETGNGEKGKRRQRGFQICRQFKDHRDLIGAPNEGYDFIHSLNTRTLYQKAVPKFKKKKLYSSRMKKIAEGFKNKSNNRKKNQIKKTKRGRNPIKPYSIAAEQNTILGFKYSGAGKITPSSCYEQANKPLVCESTEDETTDNFGEDSIDSTDSEISIPELPKLQW